MGERLDYSQVRPENKWKILRADWRFALWALYSSIGSIMFGFDWTGGLQLLATLPFQRQYGIPFASQPGGYLVPALWQSGWNASVAAGDAVGCGLAGFLMNRIGRKPIIYIGCAFNLLGIGLLQASHEWKLFLVGRLINGIGFGMIFTFSPVWIGEIVRPELRGFFLCLLNGSIVVGQFVMVGTFQIVGPWSYKTLIVVQYLLPAILLAGVFWFPESAYYLIKNGKFEEARQALNRTHGSADQDFINVEMKRITENVRFSEELKKEAAFGGPVIYQCFRGKNARRTWTGILPVIAPQLIGAFFFVGYATYFLELIGITDAFTVTCALFAVNLSCTLIAFPLIEIVGRRRLIVFGITALTVLCLIIGGCGTLPITNSTAQWCIVVGMFLWTAIEQLTIGPVGYALASEISSLPLRAQTQGILGMSQTACGWVIGFIVPYMINPDAGNLGGKVGFVFFGLGVICSILLFLYCPETKGLSYDELDYLFANGTNARKFQEKVGRLRREQGGVEPQVTEKSAETVLETPRTSETA